MKLFIDDANIEAIQKMYTYYPIDGVTTNPSILAKVKANPKDVLLEIRKIIGDDGTLFVQALGKDVNTLVEDAKAITKVLGKNTVVKIPSIPEGFQAIRTLKQLDITTCATVVYTPMQAYLGAKAGASYVAPYVNRIDNMGYDGIYATKQIHDILVKNNMDCIVLAASFKNSQQVLELAQYGVGSATLAPDIIEGLVKNSAIDQAVNDFIKDFETIGQGKTMKDYL